MPKADNLLYSRLSSTVSKAFYKSIRIMAHSLPTSISPLVKSVRYWSQLNEIF